VPQNTADFDIPKPLDTDKPPGIEEAVGPGFDRIDELFGAIDLSQLVADDKGKDDGKLLIVKDGAVAYKAMKGDGTIDEEGVLAIGAKKILTAMLADLGVTTAKLDNESVAVAKLAKALKGGVEDAKVRIHGPAVLVQRATAQEVKNKTWTAVSFSSSAFDTDAAWSAGAPTKLVAPLDGIYIATGFWAMKGNETGARVAGIFKTEIGAGGEILAELSVDGHKAEIEGDEGGNGLVVTSIPVKLKAGEVVLLGAYQNSGGALNLLAGDGIHSIKFGMHWVRPF
jgi:hypothetical protein